MHLGIFWIQCTLLFTSAVCLQVEHQSISASAANQSPPQFAIFNSNSFFVVPSGVNRLRVLVVGGGGGGSPCYLGGGGSGYVRSGEFDVKPGESMRVIVGAGGAGSPNDTCISRGGGAGGTSSFGDFLMAAGGNYTTTIFYVGSGGSGGGEGTYCTPSTSGAGGTDGSSGLKSISNTTTCNSGYGVGSGQGSFTPLFKLFTRNRLTPGTGGSGRTVPYPYHPGGGGAGGVLLNGRGPTAQAGVGGIPSGFGGSGFGAGGGAGGTVTSTSWIHFGGGGGADGLVYVEW